MNSTAKAADRNVQAVTAQVFQFKQEHDIRIQVIDGEPWFCLADVCETLTVDRTSRLLRDLDEKGVADCQTLTKGGQQSLKFVNEPNLYRVIFRSNKPEAKQFQDWVFNEVLPDIRKHGRYEDHGTMATLMDELIGMSELNVIKGLIRDKAKVIPLEKRHGFRLAMHNRLHTRFNVPRSELIPAAQFETACNFIAAYALEGEWLPKEESGRLGAAEWSNIGFLVACVEQTYKVFEKNRLYHHLDGLGCKAGAEILGFLWDGLGSAAHVRKYCADELASAGYGRIAA
ncbi:hypothetical protein D9M71_34070 [compost metagenome]